MDSYGQTVSNDIWHWCWCWRRLGGPQQAELNAHGICQYGAHLEARPTRQPARSSSVANRHPSLASSGSALPPPVVFMQNVYIWVSSRHTIE